MTIRSYDSASVPAVLYTVGGTVQANGGRYLTRSADNALLEVCRSGEFAYILTARQMGKSSLMLRTASCLAEFGVRTVQIDLTLIGTQVDAEQWYFGLLYEIRKQLQLPVSLAAWWGEHATLGPTQRFVRFCTEVVLAHVAEPVVIFVDEIDTTLGLDFTDDFYAAIRGLYLDRGQNSALQRLSFVLIGVATPSDLVRDPRRTPFNIGRRIEVGDFTSEEATPLADGLDPEPERARAILSWVLDWTGGHPYLTQRLCQAISGRDAKITGPAGVAGVVRDIFLDERAEQDHNLQFVRDMLTRRAPDVDSVLTTYYEVRRGKPAVIDDEQSQIKAHLKLSGVVRRTHNRLAVRNQIYRVVFDNAWIRENLSVHWSRTLRRALRVIMVLATLTITFGGLASYAFIQRAEAFRQRSVAETQAQTAVAAQATSEARRVEADQQRQIARAGELAAVARSHAGVNWERAILLALEAYRLKATAQSETTLRTLLSASALRQVVNPEAGPIQQLALSPTGLLIGSAHRDGAVRLWDSVTLAERGELAGHQGTVTAIAFSPDGRTLASGGEDGAVRVWNVETREMIKVILVENGPVHSLWFRPDGRQLLTLSSKGIAQLWPLPSGKPIARLNDDALTALNVAYSPDGKWIVTGHKDGIAQVWDSQDGSLFSTLDGHVSTITSVAINDSSTRILTTSADGTARVWEATTGTLIYLLVGHTNIVKQGIFGPDGQIITASSDGSVRIWSQLTGEQVRIRIFDSAPEYILLNSSGTRLSVRDKQGIKIWDLRTNLILAAFQADASQIDAVLFNPLGTELLTGGNDGLLRQWDVLPWREGTRVPFTDSSWGCAGFSPDGQLFFAGNSEGTAIWSSSSGELQFIVPFKPLVSWDSCIWFSRDSSRYVKSMEGEQSIISLVTGETVKSFSGPAADTLFAFTPTERQLLIARRNGTIDIVDTETGRVVKRFLGHNARVFSAYFDENGNLVTGSNDGTGRRWDITTGKQLAVYSLGQAACYRAVAALGEGVFITTFQDGSTNIWRPDVTDQPVLTLQGHIGCIRYSRLIPNQRLFTVGSDGTARIWDLRTGQQLMVFDGLLKNIWAGVISEDGQHLALLDEQGWRLLRWEQVAPASELEQLALARVGRSLTCEERQEFLQEMTCDSEQDEQAQPTQP